tara:strand:+ start:225 stop:518 length:294 start_codon:yes stop_codon:yes gene_type:complete
MKKLKLSVAALIIATSSYGQTKSDEITLSRSEVIEMKNILEDILEWQEYDKERGETGMGSYEEKWGSAYWLTVMRDKLCDKLNVELIAKCENCDEID